MGSKSMLIILFLAIFQVCSSLKIFNKYEVEFEQTIINGPNDEAESNPVSDKCMECICEVESGCNKSQGCQMDVGSLSCGPFQIKEPYWEDCGKPMGDYQTCAKDYQCAFNCVERYMARYIKYSGCTPNCEAYARMHNGGPRGCKNPNTLPYWKQMVKKGCTPYS